MTAADLNRLAVLKKESDSPEYYGELLCEDIQWLIQIVERQDEALRYLSDYIDRLQEEGAGK